MSIQGWVMQRPSQNEVAVLCRVGRIPHVWENTYRNAGIVAADTEIPNGATNGGSGYTVTFSAPTAVEVSERTQISTIDNLNNDSTGWDSFRRFSLTNLPAGSEIPFTISVDTGANYGTVVSGILKTIPNGDIVKCYGSCVSRFNDSGMWTAPEDYGTYLPIARLVKQLGANYFSYIDDFNYVGVGGRLNTDAPGTWMCPNDISNSEFEESLIGILDSTNSYLNASSDATGTYANFAFYAYLRMCFLNPAFQMIGQHCPVIIIAGDHDYIGGNDHDWFDGDTWLVGQHGPFTGLNGYSANQLFEGAGLFAKKQWDRIFGKESFPATYASAPTTAQVPWGLLNALDIDGVGTPASGVPTTDYPNWDASIFYPGYCVVESDYLLDIHSDFFSHRGAKAAGAGQGGDTLLGAAQYADLVSKLTATNKGNSADKPFVVLSNAKQLLPGIINNADGYTSTLPSGPTEHVNLLTHLGTLDKAIASFSGDSHALQIAISENKLVELNVAGISQSNTFNITQETDATGLTVRFDDLYNDVGFNSTLEGEHVSDWSDGVRYDDVNSPAVGSGDLCGFGYSKITASRAYHAMLDSQGYVIGGVIELAPYDKTIRPASPFITYSQVNGMEVYEFLATPVFNAAASAFGFGKTHGGDDIASFLDLQTFGELGAIEVDRYYAAMRGIYMSSTNKGRGLSVSFDLLLSLAIMDTANSGGVVADAWPTGMKITASETDNSDPKVIDLTTLPASQSLQNTYRRFAVNTQDGGGSPGLGFATQMTGTHATIFTAVTADGNVFQSYDLSTGYTIENLTTGESAVITANTATTVTVASITGGFTANDICIVRPTTPREMKYRIEFQSQGAGGAGGGKKLFFNPIR